LPSQTLEFHAALYSGGGGSGGVTGTIDTTFAGGTAVTISTATGQAASGVVVSPQNLSLAAGNTSQLYAAAQDSNGELVLEASAPTWSSNGPAVATVSKTGLVSAVSAGQVTVSASLAGATGGSTVVVTGITRETWTIMVFMNAANNLDADSIVNEAQMEQIAQTPTSATRMVIQWKLSASPQAGSTDVSDHPFEGTRRYLEVKGGKQLVQDMGQGIDMGSAATLQNFVNWSVQNYPAQHYMLVVWDHGDGWTFKLKRPRARGFRGISYDQETGNHINVNQLAGAISPNKLDIISFDACQMQMLEVEAGLTGVANLMVCSEDNTPDPGYPYDTAFSQFYLNPTGNLTALAKAIVDADIARYEDDPTYGGSPISQSVVDLTKVGSVTSALNGFVTKAFTAESAVGAVTPTIRSGLINYAAGESYFYYDLGAIATAYSKAGVPGPVVTAAQALQEAEANAVVYSRTNTGGNPVHSLSPNSTGLSIEFGSSTAFAGYSSNYAQLTLAQETQWPSFLGNHTLNP
jgi:hypothetical protein